MISNLLKKIRPFVGDKKVKKGYVGAQKVYSAGNWVTYYVDTNNTKSEEFDEGTNVLVPTTFSPSKSGWLFHGWRENNVVSSSVLSSKIMEDDPLNLFAVFNQVVNAVFYSGLNKATTNNVDGTRYYNNGNIQNASVTAPTGAAISGWTWRGWSGHDRQGATEDVSFANGNSVGIEADKIYYGLYQQPITLSYNGNGATGGSTSAQSGTRYYNSSNNYSDPTFTISNNGFSRTNKSFVAWALGSIGGTRYSPGNVIPLSANNTLYAIWQQVYTPYTISGTGDKQFTAFTWTPYTYSTGGYDYNVDSYSIYIEAEKTGGNMAICSYTATLPTQGCNWIRVKYDVNCDSGCGASIMDTQLVPTDENGGLTGLFRQDQYAYFNISEDATSISFTIQTTSSAGYDETGGVGILRIEEIYFYYE